MRGFLICFPVLTLGIALVALPAQVPGTISVSTTIVATAGAAGDATQVICTGTPGLQGGISAMHMVCTAGGQTLHTSDSSVPSENGASVTISVQRGANAVTWLLTKGNPAPDGWSVAANGTQKSGSF